MGCMSETENVVCEKCGYPADFRNEPHQLPVGTLLRGQYVVGRVLGQGGFGITYLGWELLLFRQRWNHVCGQTVDRWRALHV